MAVDGVGRQIVQYLNTPTPSYAVLLRGEWGVGKSFYWRHFAQAELPSLRKTEITFSAAGLTTLAELERALFLASIQDFGEGLLQETGTVVGRALLRWVKVDPKDIKLKANVRPDHTVICIDDVERFGGQFSTLFGFVVSLLDDAKLHVVLIADEKRAIENHATYRDYKERIVSRTFDVIPPVQALYEDVASGFSHAKTRDALADIMAHALELFREKHIVNLRTVRAILDELNALLSAMAWPDGESASLGPLLSAVTFHALALSKDAGNAAVVGRAFLLGDLGMALVMNKREEAQAEPSDNEVGVIPVGRLIRGLGFEADAYEWPASASFAEYVMGGTSDANAIAGDFAVFGARSQSEQSFLQKFQEYRSMDDSEFDQAVAKLREMVETCEFGTVQELWSAYQIFDHLASCRLTDETPEACSALFLSSITRYDLAKLTSGSLEIFPEGRNEHQHAVLDALRGLAAQFEAKEQEADTLRVRRALVEGDGEEPREIHTPLFVDAEPRDIYERLKAADKSSVRRMQKFFRRRLGVSNIAEFVAADGPFASGLADLIESELPRDHRLSLDEAAFNELAKILRVFAARVEEKGGGVTSTGK